jgi:hypothetical protein
MYMQSLFQAGFILQVYGITSGRLVSIVAGVVGLLSIIIGRIAMVRSTRRTSSSRFMGTAALVMGLIGIVVCVFHLATAKGNIGTGSGRLGAIVALILGLIGTVLGGLALSRSK